MKNSPIFSGILVSAGLCSSAIGVEPAAEKEKVEMCTTCHGANGISKTGGVPNLAGQKKLYLSKTLKDFRSGDRSHPLMTPIVKDLSDTDIENLANYFSGQ